MMKSTITKRSVMIAGRKTSVSLEDVFWNALKEIAEERNQTLTRLITTIHQGSQSTNLSSAIRLFVLARYRDSGAQPDDAAKRSRPAS